VAPGGADLLLDEVEVVQQPLGGRSEALVLLEGGLEPCAGVEEGLLVVGEPREQPIGYARREQGVTRREHGTMPLHALGAE
jgi:hypothetical protein